jgi:hypothetical protein
VRIRECKLNRKVLVVLGLFVAAGGCSKTDQRDLQTADRLRIIVAAYLDYAVAKGTGPTNELQLRKHLSRTLAFVAAKSQGLDDATLLLSGRDGKPFAIEYGLQVSLAPGTRAAPIAYEQQGEEGTRFVAFANGVVDCVDETTIQPLLGSN